MKKPDFVNIDINWIDENGEEQNAKFDQTDLDQAVDLINLMSGNITEDDLKP